MKQLAQSLLAGAAGALLIVTLMGAGTSIQTDGDVVAEGFVGNGSGLTGVEADLAAFAADADRVDGLDAQAFALAAETYTKSEVDALISAAGGADSRRAFYQTASDYFADTVLTACATGFHMASLWEVLDVSNLRYATDAEGASDVARTGDSGSGPPITQGWIRTGYISDGTQANTGSSGDAGLVNCEAWSTKVSTKDGTLVALKPCWQEEADCTSVGAPDFARWWVALESSCEVDWPVWCVQD